MIFQPMTAASGKVNVEAIYWTENLKLNESFCTWMDKHANFRTICEEGKGMEIGKQSR